MAENISDYSGYQVSTSGGSDGTIVLNVVGGTNIVLLHNGQQMMGFGVNCGLSDGEIDVNKSKRSWEEWSFCWNIYSCCY